MTSRASLPLLLVAALLPPACNAYDPDLGDRPFRCGESDPRCPDGYQCVVYSADMQLCERAGEGPLVDAAFDCNEDATEPNNSAGAAFMTPIPSMSSTFGLVDIAVCPSGDVDVFRLGSDVAGKNLRADITFNPDQGELTLEILNSSETVIRTGAALQSDAQTMRAEVPNLPAGTYYVKVGGAAGVENNYSIDVELTGP